MASGPNTSWQIDGEKVETVIINKTGLEPGMEQQIGSKLGKEYVKAVYCHPAYLTYMQNTSWEMLDWMKDKLETRLPREIPMP